VQLQLETVAYCNAACVFCPYPTMTRQRGVMPMPLYARIIDQAAEIPRIDKITLTGLGEPLLDPKVVARVDYARFRKPSAEIDLYTNGSFLKPAVVDALSEAGLSTLYVSLNAANASKREQIMRLKDYHEVVGYIEYARAHGKFRTIVKAVMEKDLIEQDEAEEFLARWGGPLQLGGNAFMHLEGNWAGEMGRPMRVLPTTACYRALDQIMVLWDGRVSLCCFDGEGQVIFGDLNEQTIKEVFDGEKAWAYRLAHAEGRRAELELCRTCTAI